MIIRYKERAKHRNYSHRIRTLVSDWSTVNWPIFKSFDSEQTASYIEKIENTKKRNNLPKNHDGKSFKLSNLEGMRFLLSKTTYGVGQRSTDCQNRSEIFKILFVRSNIWKPFGSGPTGFDPWIPVVAWVHKKSKTAKRRRYFRAFGICESDDNRWTTIGIVQKFKLGVLRWITL